jgi:hypothetical protein
MDVIQHCIRPDLVYMVLSPVDGANDTEYTVIFTS